MTRLQSDLDLACLRTIVKLLDRLQLQPVDGTTRAESVHVQSRLFYRYFNLFSKALHRWKEVCDTGCDHGIVLIGGMKGRGVGYRKHRQRECRKGLHLGVY